MMNDIKAKQVLVVRTRYPDGRGGFFKPRTGKLAAQCAHASMKVLLDQMDRGYPDRWVLSMFPGAPMYEWLNGIFAKICVYVTSEEELDALAVKADEANIINAMIVDLGRTEFHGVPTKTVLAIGPAGSDEIDKITRHLPLL